MVLYEDLTKEEDDSLAYSKEIYQKFNKAR